MLVIFFAVTDCCRVQALVYLVYLVCGACLVWQSVGINGNCYRYPAWGIS